MKISCIIPTCDRPEFLREAVSSILRQSLVPLEIIVVNNGKQKAELPREISDKIIIFDLQPYIGVSRARNFGALKARGDFLAFLDDDDLWNPEYLANVSACLSRGAECVLSRIDKMRDGKVEAWKNPQGLISIENLLIYNPGAGGSNIVISKKLFDQAGGYDENLRTSEDKSLVIEVLKTGAKIETLPDNSITARVHDNGHLTRASVISQGTRQFTRKYARLMTCKQYLYNWLKIFKYRYQAGEKAYFLPYAFLAIFFKVSKL